MIIQKSELVKWIIIIIFIGVILMMFGCNPVKQVLKSKERTAQVVREYIRENPAKNDTIFKPGEVIRLDTVIYDSVPVPYPVNHRYTETHYIKEHSRDTMEIMDKKFEKLFNDRLSKVETELTAVKADRDHWRQEARFRLWLLIGLIGLIIGGAVLYVIKVLKPTVTLMK
jgi:Na+/melibiose symporter-like transporter